MNWKRVEEDPPSLAVNGDEFEAAGHKAKADVDRFIIKTERIRIVGALAKAIKENHDLETR